MDYIIVKKIYETYTVKHGDKLFECKIKGTLRRDNINPLVGDKVVIDEDSCIINEVLKRKNSLIRPPVSNIDQVLIIVSAVQPEFSSMLLDKMLDIIEYNNIKPIICITKMDLVSDKDFLLNTLRYYEKIGYKVILNNNIDELKNIFDNKITVLTGASGVGKSTLLNNIDKNLKLKTNIISAILERGKHTTRHVELLEICNGFVADTPGFSALDFIDMSKTDIRDNMIEFNLYKDKCKYKDCMHINEDDCNIKNMVKEEVILQSRYDNYKKFIEQSR